MIKTELSLEEFRTLAKDFNVIPVSRRYLADNHTPLSLYKTLAGDRAGTFLLESAEHGGVWSRYSFIGISSASTLTEVNGKASWIGTVPNGAPTDIDPLEALRITAKHLRSPIFHTSHLSLAGLLGMQVMRLFADLRRFPISLRRILNYLRLHLC